MFKGVVLDLREPRRIEIGVVVWMIFSFRCRMQAQIPFWQCGLKPVDGNGYEGIRRIKVSDISNRNPLGTYPKCGRHQVGEASSGLFFYSALGWKGPEGRYRLSVDGFFGGLDAR